MTINVRKTRNSLYSKKKRFHRVAAVSLMDLQRSQLPPSASSPVWPLLALTLALTFLVSTQQAIAGSRLADQRNVIFDRYTTEDGLSHAGVKAITQDQYGFMWIGTQEGLNRFDGYKFENFYHRDDIEGTISKSLHK